MEFCTSKIGKDSTKNLLNIVRSKIIDGNPRSVREVAIVGAGAAGLITSEIFQRLGFQITIYEETNHIGGVWKLRPNSAMYPSLRTNLPKEIMSFNNDDNFDSIAQGRSFLTPHEVQQYLEDFAVKYNLLSVIQFQHRVISLKKLKDSKWELLTTFPSPGSKEGDDSAYPTKKIFDAVIVCNGHFNVPSFPRVSGLESNFQGIVYHSKEYQELQEDNYRSLRNKRVVVVGTRSSGTDIARELSSPQLGNTIFVADRNLSPETTKVTISTENPNIHILPALKSCKLDGRLVFSNSYELNDIDAIIFCTGYSYDYPFLVDDLKDPTLFQLTNKMVRPLYHQLIPINNPTLSFIGLPFLIIPFPLFYYQALYLSLVYSDIITLPSKEKQYEQLRQYEDQLRQEELSKYQINPSSDITEYEHYHQLGMKQFDYYRDLVKSCHESLINTFFKDKKETCVVDDFLAHQLRYIEMMEEIYVNNSAHRPKFVGGPDSYRERLFRVER